MTTNFPALHFFQPAHFESSAALTTRMLDVIGNLQNAQTDGEFSRDIRLYHQDLGRIAAHLEASNASPTLLKRFQESSEAAIVYSARDQATAPLVELAGYVGQAESTALESLKNLFGASLEMSSEAVSAGVALVHVPQTSEPQRPRIQVRIGGKVLDAPKAPPASVTDDKVSQKAKKLELPAAQPTPSDIENLSGLHDSLLTFRETHASRFSIIASAAPGTFGEAALARVADIVAFTVRLRGMSSGSEAQAQYMIDGVTSGLIPLAYLSRTGGHKRVHVGSSSDWPSLTGSDATGDAEYWAWRQRGLPGTIERRREDLVAMGEIAALRDFDAEVGKLYTKTETDVKGLTRLLHHVSQQTAGKRRFAKPLVTALSEAINMILVGLLDTARAILALEDVEEQKSYASKLPSIEEWIRAADAPFTRQSLTTVHGRLVKILGERGVPLLAGTKGIPALPGHHTQGLSPTDPKLLEARAAIAALQAGPKKTAPKLTG